MRRRISVVVMTLAVLITINAPSAQAAFRLEYVDGADRTDFAALPSRPQNPTTAVLSRSERFTPVRWGGAPAEYHGPSTNGNVDPWGCEAEHAQQWSSTGKYWGKYQFDRQTWAAHGGDPGSYGSAPEATQDAIASRVSYDAWPNC